MIPEENLFSFPKLHKTFIWMFVEKLQQLFWHIKNSIFVIDLWIIYEFGSITVDVFYVEIFVDIDWGIVWLKLYSSAYCSVGDMDVDLKNLLEK